MISTKLLAWFADAKRDLPWRKEPRDPYRVWISEVMLQQTRVDVVVPYYQRFLRRFPTLRALARAPLDDVLALWSGLGYYARARNLHQRREGRGRSAAPHLRGAARASRLRPVHGGGGGFPGLQRGRAAGGRQRGARPARVHALRGDARARAWKIAADILPAGRAGEFNEALMELGATVCTPRSPECPRCPIGTLCAVRLRGLDPERYPAPRKKPARPLLEWNALALTRADGSVLLARRPAGALFAGLWDLPQATPAGVRIQGKTVGRGAVEQTLTHREVRVVLRSARASGTPESADVRWVAPEGLVSLGLSSLARKSLRQAGVLKRPSGRRP